VRSACAWLHGFILGPLSADFDQFPWPRNDPGMVRHRRPFSWSLPVLAFCGRTKQAQRAASAATYSDATVLGFLD